MAHLLMLSTDLFYADPHIVHTVQQLIEVLGTIAFAISGLRHACAKHYDWFGGYVCGFAVALGGGTIRDVLLGVTPFWMTSSLYVLCTLLAFLIVVCFGRYMKRLDNAWFAFDTLGMALFVIAGIQKTVGMGYPYWVAIIMGCLTGSAGGVIRDVLLNNVPVIFHKEIYAMACVLGGMVYWLMIVAGIDVPVTVIVTFLVICAIRFFAVKYHIGLPTLKNEGE